MLNCVWDFLLLLVVDCAWSHVCSYMRHFLIAALACCRSFLVSELYQF